MYRVYYNRRADYPFIWSVDNGDQSTEQNVIDVQLHRSNANTGGDMTVPRHSTDVPSVWFEVWHAKLVITDNVAHFFHDDDWRVPRIGEP